MINIRTGLPKIVLQDINKKNISLLDYKNRNLLFIIAQCVDFEEQEARNLWSDVRLLLETFHKEITFFLLPVWDWKSNINKDDMCPFMRTSLFEDVIRNENLILLKPVNKSSGVDKHPIINWFDTVKKEEYDGDSFLESGKIKDNFIKIFIHKSGVIANKFKAGDVSIQEVLNFLKSTINTDLVWTKEQEIPYDFIEAFWGQTQTEEDEDYIDSIKIIDL